jgi:hypothetical protein
MVIRVEQDKGGRDRYVMLSQLTFSALQLPIPTVLHDACRSACAAAGLNKRVMVHTFRHSSAILMALPRGWLIDDPDPDRIRSIGTRDWATVNVQGTVV